jgi:hypothetical protein
MRKLLSQNTTMLGAFNFSHLAFFEYSKLFAVDRGKEVFRIAHCTICQPSWVRLVRKQAFAKVSNIAFCSKNFSNKFLAIAEKISNFFGILHMPHLTPNYFRLSGRHTSNVAIEFDDLDGVDIADRILYLVRITDKSRKSVVAIFHVHIFVSANVVHSLVSRK